MLQVDLETLVSACAGGSSDRKIGCETLADDHSTDQSGPLPDSPPESFWLSRDEEYDWWDRNAVYERKESTKGHSNSNSTSLNPGSNSQRFSLNLKSKAAILGLPKPQKTSFTDAKNRRNHKPSNIGLFPKRNVSVGKSESSLVEPSSPKVSCMGRVRSKRDRNRRLRSSRKSCSDMDPEKPDRTGKKSGFFESFRAIFRSGRRGKATRKTGHPVAESVATTSVNYSKPRDSIWSVNDVSFEETISRNSLSESEPPGLGGMMRFASGRRAASWGVGDSESHVPQYYASGLHLSAWFEYFYGNEFAFTKKVVARSHGVDDPDGITSHNVDLAGLEDRAIWVACYAILNLTSLPSRQKRVKCKLCFRLLNG
ncbi:hypothetical protein VNO77_17806 [Canavalia gladiata]|uniref:Uncharacterized protein n=1 Tax=Canavalia gladiata TaxID=3824 RepID=A0AAN9LKE4_CANGL